MTCPATDLPTLRGPRVTLRPPAPGEPERFAAAIAADPIAGPRWSTDLPTMVRWLTDEELCLLTVECEGEPIGIVDFEEQSDPNYRSAGIDISLLEPWLGRGLGTEAVKLIATWLIDARGHHRLTIDPAADNSAAIHAYEKVGFRRIGVARSYELGSDGTWHDNLLMDLLAEELARL
jgi:aminoglycoside 6'-N-acetyltransferase